MRDPWFVGVLSWAILTALGWSLIRDWLLAHDAPLVYEVVIRLRSVHTLAREAQDATVDAVVPSRRCNAPHE